MTNKVLVPGSIKANLFMIWTTQVGYNITHKH